MATSTMTVTLDASDFIREMNRVTRSMASMRALAAPAASPALPAIALAAVAAGSTRRVSRRGLLCLSWLRRNAPSEPGETLEKL